MAGESGVTSSSSEPGSRFLLLLNGPMPPELDAMYGSFPQQVGLCLARCGVRTVLDNPERVGSSSDAYHAFIAHHLEASAPLDPSVKAAVAELVKALPHVRLEALVLYGPDADELPDVASVSARYAGVIMSGSVMDVTDRAEWMLRAEAWIRDALGRVPMLGICFGHQLLATALGGTVGRLAGKPAVGLMTMRRLPPKQRAADGADSAVAAAASNDVDPLIGTGLPDELFVSQLNSQGVLTAPDAATPLYGGAAEEGSLEKAGMLRFDNDAKCPTYGVQFHPEFTAGFVRDLGRQLSYGPKEEKDVAAFKGSLARPLDASVSIIARFAVLAKMWVGEQQARKTALV